MEVGLDKKKVRKVVQQSMQPADEVRIFFMAAPGAVELKSLITY